MRLNVLITLSSVVALTAGCASPQGQGAGEGCAAGAVVGALICLKCSPADRAKLAAAGCAVGGVVGYSLADDIQKRKQALAGRENDLNARLQYVRGLNADTEKFNTQLRSSVASATKQIEEGQRSGQALQKQRSDLDKQIADANTQIQAADQELAGMRRFRAQQPAPNPQLDAEINRLNALLADARTNTSAMASLRARI